MRQEEIRNPHPTSSWGLYCLSVQHPSNQTLHETQKQRRYLPLLNSAGLHCPALSVYSAYAFLSSAARAHALH